MFEKKLAGEGIPIPSDAEYEDDDYTYMDDIEEIDEVELDLDNMLDNVDHLSKHKSEQWNEKERAKLDDIIELLKKKRMEVE